MAGKLNAADGGGPKHQAAREFLARTLEFIGYDGKTLHQVAEFYTQNGKTLGRDGDPFANIRTTLWSVRAKDGFVDNPSKGFYRLTEKGTAFVKENLRSSGANAMPEMVFVNPVPMPFNPSTP